MEKIQKTHEEWRKELDAQTYNVTREGGTEAPFSGKYYAAKDRGMYKCSNCGLELFSSDTKFDSGTGWPSFTDPVNKENIDLVIDNSQGMERVEVRCKRCGAHLGHVFDDLPRFVGKAGGPTDKGGKRFCINSCTLSLEEK